MKKLNSILVVISILCAFVSVGYFVYSVNRGYNLADEGFYLLGGAYPYDTKQQLTSFNYYLHILMALSSNIIFLRLTTLTLNIVSIMLLSFSLSKVFGSKSKSEKINILLILTSMITVSMLTFIFPQEPNYNSLTVTGTIITFSLIILLFYSKNIRFCNSMLFIIGFMSIFVFFNKFSSGIILIFISILAYVIYSIKIKKFTFIGFISLFFGILCHFILYFLLIQNRHLFLSTYRAGFLSMKIIQSNHDINLLTLYYQQIQDLFKFSYVRYHVVISLLTIVTILSQFTIFTKLKTFRIFLSYLVLTVFFGLSYIIDSNWNAERFMGLSSFYFSAIVAIFFIWLTYFRLENIKKINFDSIVKFLIILSLFFLPIIVAVGTNNLIYMQIILSCFVWMPIYIFISLRVSMKNEKTFTLYGVAGISLLSLHYSIHNFKELPYGLYGNLQDQKHMTTVHNTKLYLDATSKKIIDETQIQLKKCGFKPNDYLVSLTDIPGLTYAVGGRSPSCSWYFGSYNGADKFTKFCLNLSPEVKSPLILLDHYAGQQNGFSESQLGNYFSNFSQRYEQCGEVKNIPTTGGVCCKVPIDNIKIYGLKANFRVNKN